MGVKVKNIIESIKLIEVLPVGFLGSQWKVMPTERIEEILKVMQALTTKLTDNKLCFGCPKTTARVLLLLLVNPRLEELISES